MTPSEKPQPFAVDSQMGQLFISAAAVVENTVTLAKVIDDSELGQDLGRQIREASSDGAKLYADNLDGSLGTQVLADPTKFNSTRTVERRQFADAIDNDFRVQMGFVGQALFNAQDFSTTRLADHLLGPTPAADVKRFLAVTQRKVEELQSQVSALLLEALDYDGINERHIGLARDGVESGLLFLAKALNDVEIDDLK